MTNNPLAIAGMERAGEMLNPAENLREHLAREGVPHRRKADKEAPEQTVVAPALRVLSDARVRGIIDEQPTGPDLAARIVRAVEDEILAMMQPQLTELLEIARTVAAVADELNYGSRPSKHNPMSLPVDFNHPLHRNKSLVLAAQRQCLRHGYRDDGSPSAVGGQVKPANPEALLMAREQGDRDYVNVYRWLFCESLRQGYESVHAAILAAPKGTYRV